MPAKKLIYLYGFGATQKAAVKAWPRMSGVENESPVEWIECNGIGGIASFVPAGSYEKKPLEKKLRDPRWLALRADRHNAVLLAISEQTAVAPCRFGTVLYDLPSLQAIIERDRIALARSLRRLHGRVEWAIKASMNDGAALAYLDEHNERASEGSKYLLSLARQRAARLSMRQRAQNHAAEIMADLAPFLDKTSPLAVQNGSSRAAEQFLNLACLVPRKNIPALCAKLAALAEREKAHGITLAWSGPWPAYSFVCHNLENRNPTGDF